jgi:hypothetical protein
LLLSWLPLARAEDDPRFSKALAPQEFSSAGLTLLSSDQIAILDALVRRDVASAARSNKPPAPAEFTQRLTADERRNAGLDLLADEQRSQVDAFVQRLIAPPPVGPSFSDSGSGSLANAVRSVKINREPQIHGTVALMVAAGSGGYSAFGGGMALTYDDPANRFSVTVAYSEIHEKGDFLRRDYRDHYWPTGPYSSRLRDPFW